jgi:hypothetical protein
MRVGAKRLKNEPSEAAQQSISGFLVIPFNGIRLVAYRLANRPDGCA